MIKYCEKENIAFSRSRPYKKNGNCFVEQKNATHVRGVFGHLRYDTEKEIKIINSLYKNELRFHKNFFQPVMKLKEKERIKGSVKRKYDTPKTPYQRLLESGILSETQQVELKNTYENLNPAQLKRTIDKKTQLLFELYMKKNGASAASPFKRNTLKLNNFGQVLDDSTTLVSVR